jgi:hypothetical protein
MFFSFFDRKLQFTYVQGTGEACSPQKRTFSTSKNEKLTFFQKMKFINFFLFLWVIFALLDLDPDPGTPLNPDPAPQHCLEVGSMRNRNVQIMKQSISKILITTGFSWSLKFITKIIFLTCKFIFFIFQETRIWIHVFSSMSRRGSGSSSTLNAYPYGFKRPQN